MRQCRCTFVPDATCSINLIGRLNLGFVLIVEAWFGYSLKLSNRSRSSPEEHIVRQPR